MLSIHVVNDRQDRQFEHPSGPLELGRGPRQQAECFVVEDPFVSRDHVSVEELWGERLRIKNLSQKKALVLPDGTRLAPGTAGELILPVKIQVGNTQVAIESIPADAFDEEEFQTLDKPVYRLEDSAVLASLGEAPSVETVAHWLETIITLQRSPVGSREFYDQTSRALVELVGLDVGMVLLRDGEGWQVAGRHVVPGCGGTHYSRTLLAHVLQQRRTFYQCRTAPPIQAASLLSADAVVASPMFGLHDDVSGVLYGVRTRQGRGGIRHLEAQVVQLLAGALGANLVRTVATRTRTQFEQFFSSELVRELERNPQLLESRNQEVTILFSDLRGFTRLAEKLGPEVTCRLVRDVMECLTDRIALHGGAIVDYAGDGILAMWNAPVPQPDHVARACRAALAMLEDLPRLNASWQTIAGMPIAFGVGINTGPALVGNTGTSRRLQYGPFGLTVNVASRIQDATKRVGAPLLVSGTVRDLLPSGFHTRSVGPVSLPGVSGETELFELTGDFGTLRNLNSLTRGD
ncbi:MAG: adenylate/guanylate cyclase domain-containing protein [Gemmataceae bacterium]|nr:adenylate/guanylate cyclase domain-containing protein [Gemmataceae bacterium]